MLIGTNDLDQGAEPEVVAANLKAIVAELHAADRRCRLSSTKYAARAKPANIPKIVALNALYEAAFKNDPKITFCDTWTLFDDQ